MSTILKRTQLARQILQIQHELRSTPRSRLPHPLAALRRQLTARRALLIAQLHALTRQRITQTLLHRLAATTAAPAPAPAVANIVSDFMTAGWPKKK